MENQETFEQKLSPQVNTEAEDGQVSEHSDRREKGKRSVMMRGIDGVGFGKCSFVERHLANLINAFKPGCFATAAALTVRQIGTETGHAEVHVSQPAINLGIESKIEQI